MAMEIIGSLLIRIHFGSTVYGLGAIIGVFLLTVVLGNVWGGCLRCRQASAVPHGDAGVIRPLPLQPTPDGVLAVNLLDAVSGTSSRLFRTVYKTLTSSPDLWSPEAIHILRPGAVSTDRNEVDNIILLMSASGVRIEHGDFVAQADQLATRLAAVRAANASATRQRPPPAVYAASRGRQFPPRQTSSSTMFPFLQMIMPRWTSSAKLYTEVSGAGFGKTRASVATGSCLC